jgi:lipoprotein-anchoring transpeptidase ErfK/SrfK
MILSIRNAALAVLIGVVLAGCSSSRNAFDAYSGSTVSVASAQVTNPEQEFAMGSSAYSREPRTVGISNRYSLPVGSVLVSTLERKLYYVVDRHTAYVFDVAVGKEGFTWSGVATVGDKQVDPTWTPPAEMIERKPQLVQWASGMPGGIPENPLGTRALYLFDKSGKDTQYRIHGTNDPSSIGGAESSGCIRMHNEDVERLYELVELGARVYVLDENDDRAKLIFEEYE